MTYFLFLDACFKCTYGLSCTPPKFYPSLIGIIKFGYRKASLLIILVASNLRPCYWQPNKQYDRSIQNNEKIFYPKNIPYAIFASFPSLFILPPYDAFMRSKWKVYINFVENKQWTFLNLIIFLLRTCIRVWRGCHITAAKAS